MIQKDTLEELKDCLESKKILLFDGDGTLYLGDQLIPGAPKIIQKLQETKHVYLSTNNSSKTPAVYIKKMKRLGFNFKEERILISSHPTLHYLKENKLNSIYLVGTKAVREWFATNGVGHTETNPQAIVLTYDTELDYQKIKDATEYVREGLPYLVTHPDLLCPTETGPIPDIGTLINAIEDATKRRPDLCFGKPYATFMQSVCAAHNCSPKDILMVGDRLYTDIQLTQDNEAHALLVLSGETTEQTYKEASIKADFVLSSIKDLGAIL